jgi:hypothetical protein
MKRELLEQETHGEKQTAMHYAAKYGCIDSIIALRQDEDANDSILEARDYQGIHCSINKVLSSFFFLL